MQRHEEDYSIVLRQWRGQNPHYEHENKDSGRKVPSPRQEQINDLGSIRPNHQTLLALTTKRQPCADR